METTIISGVFDSLQTASKTIQALHAAHFPQDKVSVHRPDSNEFHAISRKLDSRQIGRPIVITGCVGILLGILLAIHAILTSPPASIVLTLGPLSSLLAGAILGTMSGSLIGAAIACDTAKYNVHMKNNSALSGKRLISVCVESAVEQCRAEMLLMKGGAGELHTAKATAADQSSSGAKASTRSAFHTLGHRQITRFLAMHPSKQALEVVI